ncbi:MAG TPA: DUF1697 domain-containing protein [Feifaniaceae bacterium]|nr:DUF1697 domain-containing protein [Feifaniaceae bacterium]
MNRYCVFLRGVNVNGVSVKIAALREAFWAMGYPGAKTALASGNVIVSLEDGADIGAHKAKIERGLSAAFSYGAHVLLRSEAELASLIETAGKVSVPEGCHLYALFIEGPEALAALEDGFSAASHGPDERLISMEKDAFWIVKKGGTLDTEFSKKVLGRRLKSALTSRNINTVQKVAAMMAKRP